MFERITPNVLDSYEQSLIEYVGYCYIDNNGALVAATSPAVQVTYNSAETGTYIITCLDYLPIYQSILTSNAPQNVSLVYSQGYSPTLTCLVRPVCNTAQPFSEAPLVAISPAQLNAQNQVFFTVRTSLNGAFSTALGFTFKITATAQMERLVFGLGVGV